MKTVTIRLDSIEKVKGLVNTISMMEGDFDLVSGRYRVDAKSIMGIFSLDVSKPLTLEIQDDTVAEKVVPLLKDFIVE